MHSVSVSCYCCRLNRLHVLLHSVSVYCTIYIVKLVVHAVSVFCSNESLVKVKSTAQIEVK